MYTPEINFLSGRSPDTITSELGPSTGGFDPQAGGGSSVTPYLIGLVVAGLSFGAYAWGRIELISRETVLQRENAALDQDLSAANAELSARRSRQEELDGLLTRTDAFRSFFVSLQPWSAILEDFRNRVPPELWVTNLSTTVDTVSLQGQALTYEQVNDFMLTLKDSPFVQSVTLNTTQEVAGSEDTLPSVNYGLTMNLNRLQLTSEDTVAQLQTQGSLGIVEKLNILRNLEVN